jgi:AcrR family transcriptional regulator
VAKGRSPRIAGGAAPPAASDRDRILDAAFGLIGRDGWRRLSMAAIAAEAELPLLRVYREFRSKPAILCAFFRRIDEKVLAVPIESDAEERPRDRLFDLLMRRFDALGPHRTAVEMLGRELPADPLAAVAGGAGLLRSIGWMLEAAGISTRGLGGAVAVKLTAATYLATLRVWLRDDTPDLAPTMAALDRRLRGVERWLGSGRSAAPRPDAEPA